MFLVGRPVQSIRVSGRWLASRSLECYIQEAMSHLVTQQRTKRESEMLKHLTSLSRHLRLERACAP